MNGTMGGPFGNETDAGPDMPSGSLPVVTATVVPVPQDSGVADASKSFDAFSSPAEINQGQAASTPVADATAPADAEMCTTVTTTATSTQYVTVTAGSGDSAASPVDSSKPSVSVPAGFNAPSSSASLSSAVPSVSAGAFYGNPGGHSFSYGGGYGQSSAAAATTMAPSYGGGAPAPASSAIASFASSVASAASGSPSSMPSTSPSTGGNSGKKGLAYNKASLLSAFNGDSMSWAYNWADSAGGSIPSGIEYVPMCWGLNSAPGCASAAAGASHVLSFNEPDLGAQSNIDPATAAKNHIQYVNPIGSHAQIGSPAITNGAGTSPLMGIDWLNSFFDKCAGQCKVDFVAFHWYDSNQHIAYFKQHVQDVIDAAAKHGVNKVWMTEFGTTDGDSPDFIQQATSFLDSTAAVERYAYFMVDGILVNGNSLSSAGNAYVMG